MSGQHSGVVHTPFIPDLGRLIPDALEFAALQFVAVVASGEDVRTLCADVGDEIPWVRITQEPSILRLTCTHNITGIGPYALSDMREGRTTSCRGPITNEQSRIE